MAKTDALTADFLRQALSYDPETGIFIWNNRPRDHFRTKRGQSVFNAQFAGQVAGSLSPDGYIRIRIADRARLASRLAWLYVHGEPPKGEIDHENYNKTDNRICNLRDGTHSNNQHNRTAYSNNKSGYKGVSWHKDHKKWRASIKVHGKVIHLGYFQSAEEARDAYNNAAPIYHGKYARLSL